MEIYSQPSVEHLKSSTIYLTHIINTDSPKEGLKRVERYITELEERPNKFFWGTSYRRPIKQNTIEDWIEEKQIFRLPQKIIFPWEKDAWVDTKGDVYLLNAYDPKKIWEEYTTAKPFFNIPAHLKK